MRKAGISLADVRGQNRALLLRLILTGQCVTRGELSAQSGLSSMTVTNIAAELLHHGVLDERPPEGAARSPGRTPMELCANAQGPVIGGIFVARDCLYGVVSDLSLHVLARAERKLGPEETEQSVLDAMEALARRLMEQTDRQMLGIGVSTAGVVDTASGELRFITEFYSVRALPIRAFLSERLGLPVFVYNDMQASGLAELYFGRGRTEPDFLYVGICSGIGAALVKDRALVDSCGEIGHMSIDFAGPRCACGSRGCLELYASTPSILRQLREECGRTFVSLPEAVAAAGEDAAAYAVLYQAARKLAVAISSYLNLMHVHMVVLGHDAYCLPQELVKSMERYAAGVCVGRYLPGRPLRFVQATFGADTPLLGAVCTVLEQIFQGRLSVLPEG